MNEQKQKHTPGPWHVKDHGNDSEGTKIMVYVSRPETENTCKNPDVCRVYQIGGDRSSERFYNARLIAAAPDLLQALEALYNSAPCAKPANAELWEALQLTREAIRKAKGEG